MQLKATYIRGRLEFFEPLRFVRDEFPVLVDVPEDAVLAAEQPEDAAASSLPADLPGAALLASVRSALGPLRRKSLPQGVAEDKASYVEALADKYAR